MKIVLLQTDIAWGDVETNLLHAERLMKEQAGADLYVLPEMFATGFEVEPRGDEGGRVARWMRAAARRTGAAVAGSVAIYNKEKWRNRFLFVRPDGAEEWYDKRHLFALGGEGRRFTAGTERKVVEWRGVRLLLQVCFDLRFPVFSRYRGDYDAILYVASWPAPRRAAWDVLLRARALENQCYVAGVNRVGRDPQCRYTGGTVLIDARGQTVASARDDVAEAVGGVIDVERLAAFRRKFPVLEARD